MHQIVSTSRHASHAAPQVENALLLTAAELAKKREEGDAAKKAAEATQSEMDRHAGIVDQLKEQLNEVWTEVHTFRRQVRGNQFCTAHTEKEHVGSAQQIRQLSEVRVV